MVIKAPAAPWEAGPDHDAGPARRRGDLAVAATALLIAVLAFVGACAGPVRRPSAPAGGVTDGLPARLSETPSWTAPIGRAPLARALAVYSGPGPREEAFGDRFPLVIIGPADRYRIYDRADWSGAWLLSPDGRYLLMGRWSSGLDVRGWLLDVTTGRVRVLSAGAPLAWSPDGRWAALATFDGDASSTDPVAGEVRVVSVPDGRVAWRVPLAPRPMAAERLSAALSPGGSALAVQADTELSVHRRGGGTWRRVLGTAQLAGPAAFTPDGARLAVIEKNGQVTALDGGTGAALPGAPLGTVGGQPFSDPPWRTVVVGWRAGTAIVATGNRVQVATDPPTVLVRAPDDATWVEVAADALEDAPRRPGPPRPGSIGDRFATAVLAWTGVAGLLLALRVVVLMRRRARW